ncbi:katanin p80 WD40 repeat-containing subunit B1 [Carex littledalei]|uniref:Katanin p80 WD40 repeat-containing subunit B1 n=1 Tax=Carex littledalei TaxID=544730 RepID=A0A833QX19_9POAL|nr:katanin p80 WD40 repeat-containing subunit B1 [Carex littledalei]
MDFTVWSHQQIQCASNHRAALGLKMDNGSRQWKMDIDRHCYRNRCRGIVRTGLQYALLKLDLQMISRHCRFLKNASEIVLNHILKHYHAIRALRRQLEFYICMSCFLFGLNMLFLFPLCSVSGSADKTVKFWDLETFEMIGSLGPETAQSTNNSPQVPLSQWMLRYTGGVRAMTFNSDGRSMFCGLHESMKAEKELSRDWTLMRSGTPGVPTSTEWLNYILPSGARIGIDPVSSLLPLFDVFCSSS